MMRKPLATLALAALVSAMVFAGGTQESPGTTGSATVQFVFWATGPDALKGWQKTLSDFQKEHPSITLNYVGVEAPDWGQYIDKVATMIAGGQNPDVMWVATEGVRLLASKSLAYPIDDLVNRDKAELSDYLSDIPQSLLDSFRIDGKLYELPYSYNDMVMWYNTDMFQKAGIARPAADWTVQDFVKIAQQLTTSGGGQPQYGFAVDDGYFTGIVPWLYANGTTLYKNNFSQGNLDDPRVIEAVQFMYDLIYKYKVSPLPGAQGYNPTNAFMAGNLAMFGAGRWPILSFVPEGFTSADIQLWPRWRTQTAEFGVDGFAILRATKNKDVDWTLVKYMTRKNVMSRLVGGKDTPISNIPARISLATTGSIADLVPGHFTVFSDALKDSRSLPNPPDFPRASAIVGRYLSLILSNQVGVEDGLSKANQELNAVLQQ